LRWRYKTKLGEIDLIAQRGKSLVFIEVKGRESLDDAIAAVSPQSQKRIIDAARMFLSYNPAFHSHDLRFDVMAVRFPYHIKHLENAWGVF